MNLTVVESRPAPGFGEGQNVFDVRFKDENGEHFWQKNRWDGKQLTPLEMETGEAATLTPEREFGEQAGVSALHGLAASAALQTLSATPNRS